ncbi:hypothetical protein H1R20_g2757, partial [Candolleomyces eurysporus]
MAQELRARPEVFHNDAVDFIKSVQYQFEEQPAYYDQFLEALNEYNAKQIGVETLIDRVTAALHGYPHLLAGFNPFLPLPYELQSSKDPEDPHVSIVSITTPTGHETRRMSLHPDLWSLAPRQLPQDEFKLMIELINDVKKHYVDDPTVYRAFLKAIEPDPDNPKDKVVTEIEEIICDAPDLIGRLRKLMGTESPP